MIDLSMMGPGRLHVPETEAPGTAAARVYSVRDLARRNEAGELELEQQKKAIAETEALKAALGRNTKPDGSLDEAGLLSDVAKNAPGHLQKLQQYFVDSRKTRAELQTKELELRSKRAERMGAIASSIVDEPSFHRGIAMAMSEGHITPEQGKELLNMPWNPETQALVNQFKQQAIGAKDAADLALRTNADKRAEEDQKFKREDRPTDVALKQADLAGKQADATGKQLGLAVQMIPNNQTDWTTWRAGLPPAVQARVPDMYSPAAAEQVRAMALTERDRQEFAGQAAGRAEQARHNKAEEGLTVRGQNMVDRRSHDALLAQTGNNAANQEGKLRDDYRTESKTFITTRDAVQKIENAAESKTGAGDIALVYGYMKALDPGSTVREGEYATAANASGVPDTVSNLYNRVLRGEKLPEPTRQQMVAEAKKLLGAAQANQTKIDSYYRGLSERYKLNPQNVLTDYSSGTFAHTATGPDGHKIGSNDGKSWFDLQTGRKIN